jgi:hypothetical protein
MSWFGSRTDVMMTPGTSEFGPEPVIPRVSIKVSDAAKVAVPLRQSVLTLSAKKTAIAAKR